MKGILRYRAITDLTFGDLLDEFYICKFAVSL